ncbi:MAG: hypothetical protein CMF22_07430 [Idiomarinaceae bacterium]|nr:hypothetical protein [Idiomarinaceae bacterium]|tara:strand:- start:1448 stop:1666 length:219 start_codon:yes stop_codon:yes gene_type:complete
MPDSPQALSTSTDVASVSYSILSSFKKRGKKHKKYFQLRHNLTYKSAILLDTKIKHNLPMQLISVSTFGSGE